MTATLDRETTTGASTAAAEELRTSMAAVRVSVSWLGVRKTLTPAQKAQAADTFGAEGQFISAGKKLLDTRHPVYKELTAVRNRIMSYWKGMTLPYPEPGIRLIRQSELEPFDRRMSEFREELAFAVSRLERHYGQLKRQAANRLGSLYNASDYPDSLRGLFGVEWDFPSVEPPEYLRQLNPEIYTEERRRVAARFDEAVRLAEEAFTSELAALVSHLRERITGESDGKPKVFRDSAVENLTVFFERFRNLSVRSSSELDRLVDQVQEVVRGVAPQALRDSQELRQHVAGELGAVQSVLDNLLVERPRRNIIRRTRPAEVA
jgi:hypothetical protein